MINLSRGRFTGVYDRYRWLRSDGAPNFNQRVVKRPGTAALLAKRCKEIYSPGISILQIFEIFYRESIQVLPLIKIGRRIDSVVSVRELISLLGGVYTSLIEVKHGGKLIEALNREPAKSISRRDFPMVREEADLEEVLETLILGEKGYVIVVDKDDNLVGYITDRDIIEFFREKRVGIKVSEVMSSQLITMNLTSNLCDVIREMNILNIRRIPLVREDRSVSGIVLARDIIDFIGSHAFFKYASTGLYEEFCKLPSGIVARDIATISPEADIGEASEKMLSQNIDYLLVASGDEIIGIITERDIIYGYVVLSRS